MPVRFAGSVLTPAPLIDIQRNSVRKANGSLDYIEYTFTLDGTIVNVDSALDSPGAASATGMVGILGEQDRIRGIFGSGYGLLEIESPDSSTNMVQSYALVDSVNFEQGVWVNRCDYTIVLRARSMEGEDDPKNSLSSSEENFSVTENEDGTFSITHTLQAQGISTFYNGVANNPLESAKAWVRNKSYSVNTTGILSPTNAASGTMNLANLLRPLSATSGYWNMASVETIDPESASWQLVETFVYNPSGTVREEWTATITTENENRNRANISLNGSVFGYSDRISNTTTRFNNAKNYFYASVEPNVYIRLTSYVPTGYVVNPYYSSRQITNQPFQGNLQYTFVFTATSGTTIIPNALDENIEISDQGYVDIFATIPVPGRSNGAVIQNMRTQTNPERTVTISATILSSGTVDSGSLLSNYLAKPNTDALINILKPNKGYYYMKQNSEQWSPLKRQYSRVVGWLLVPSGVVQGVPSGINNLEN